MTAPNRSFAFGFLTARSEDDPCLTAENYRKTIESSLTDCDGQLVCLCTVSEAFVAYGSVGRIGFIIEFGSTHAAQSWVKAGALRALQSQQAKPNHFKCFICEGSGEETSQTRVRGYGFGFAFLKAPRTDIESQYSTRVAPTLKAYDGIFAAKSDKHGALETVGAVGDVGFVLEFPSGRHAHQWYESPAYQACIDQRTALMDLQIFLCEGLPQAVTH